MEAISYLVIVTFLSFSALMYLVARQGALQQFRIHVRVPRAELDRHFAGSESSMTVLVPSYAEEPEVVRQTLWSAALQEYPSLRVVLLLDDPPFPGKPEILARLDRTRDLGREINDALEEPRERFWQAQAAFEFATRDDDVVDTSDVRDLADHYGWAAAWLYNMAADEVIADHVDEFFAEQVLRGLADELRLNADALLAAAEEGATPSLDRMRELYRRLAWTFDAEVTVFERKLYSSLSHEANKAMNLNSYIGLMGGAYRTEQAPNGLLLRPVTDGSNADLVVPDSEYLLTLDADSLLLRDYCLRLVHLLEQPENARVAVTQTPYSSFRGAGSRIERLAGATTDLQHVLHQGMSFYGAAFWVGANAVIRKRALEDIVETEMVGGFEIRRYVQDRTVIEDTESSIDLGHARLDAEELPRAPQLQRDAARLRIAHRAAAPVGQRRPADPAEALAPGIRASSRRQAHPAHRAGAARQLHELDRVGELRPRAAARLPLRLATAQPAGAARRHPLLLGDVERPEVCRVQAHRRAAHLRVQPHPAAGQPRRRAQVDPAGDHRQEDPVRAHPEGEEPHRGTTALRRGAVRDRGVLALHALPRLPGAELGQCGVRRVQRDPRDLGDPRRTSASGTRSWMSGSVPPAGSSSRSCRAARRQPVAPVSHVLDWRSTLYHGHAVEGEPARRRAAPSPERRRRDLGLTMNDD